MNVSFLQELMTTVAEQGRALLPKGLLWGETAEDIETLAKALVSSRGEASGVAIARQILDFYGRLDDEAKRAFFTFLGERMQPDATAVAAAAGAYLKTTDAMALARLQKAVESPRQEFFRRLNLAPGATGGIVAMRRDLLRLGRDDPLLRLVDDDLKHLLYSWFNRGFLVLRRIDWQTPAAILEKIIQYEAVHQIEGWDDLRRRLDPKDRRCFAFFHPALIDEPLIFVEVALTHEMSDAIAPLLSEPPKNLPIETPTVAVFYSISNCQEGLKGITFGNFLIKQVVEDLVRELPSLKTFVTLSPVPGFTCWLDSPAGQSATAILLTDEENAALSLLRRQRWHARARASAAVEAPLLALAAQYFLIAKSADGKPVDPVARFHLGNGALLERINYLGDVSSKGLQQAHGLMVNYRYNLKEIEKNHEAFANQGSVPASRQVRALLRTREKSVAGKEPERLPLLALATDKARGSSPPSSGSGGTKSS
ncbi:MAG: malonyl-CoA decarboxylase [Hyphomicrobiaceae bacterium]|nr:malonyl-CoA decarboxylase [Hyphomicrobiaceae bacterium]